MSIVTQTQLENASLDALTLEAFVNGPDAVLLSRLGTSVKSLQKIIAESALSAAAYTTTSVSNIAIGTGAKTFAVATGKSFTAGQWLIISSVANPTNYMHGKVTSYTGTALVMDITNIGGSGTLASWNVAMSGTQGPIGATGATGAAGAGIYKGGTAGGAANALTFTSSPAIAAYTDLDNSLLIGKILSDNTSATVTLQVSGVASPPNIKKFIGASKVDLAVGDLQAGMLAMFSRDGTDAILLNPRTYSKAANITSAGTLDLNTATGDYVQVTGSTAITAITLEEGRQVMCQFASTPIITNGASLLNVSTANITAAAGDLAVFRGEASGVVRMVSYTRASGAALVASAGGNAFADNSYLYIDTFDDCLGKAIANYNGASSGSGAISTFSGGTCYIESITGSTATGRSAVGGNFLATASAYSVLTNSLFSCNLDVSALSSAAQRYTLYVGMHTAVGGDPVNGIYFRYTDNVNSGFWQAVCRASNVETVINSVVAPLTDNGALNQTLSWIGRSSTSVEFFINNVSIGTISTNVPNAATGVLQNGWTSQIQKSVGTTSCKVNIGQIRTRRYR